MREVGTLDAPTLRRAMTLYAQALEAHREEIDSLNVFPVPDGDTGTNMLLTQRAVDEACAGLDGAPIGTLGETIARAALLGARGNSGVILSQILRGLAEGLDGAEADGRGLASALARAHEEARKAVAEPAEGTILSVLGDAARAATGSSVEEVAQVALEAARASLERTPRQLEELRRAGVVDAGGKGLVLLLDALAAAIEGRPLSEEVGPMGPVGHEEAAGSPGPRYGSEVMYVIHGPVEGVEGLRERLASIGDSVVVVGGGELWQAHVHTDDPGLAVEEGIRTGGRLAQIRIVSLDEQVAAHCVAAEALGEVAPHSLVAVAEGEGMVAILESLGARVVAGAPSVGELVEAIELAPGRHVILLPNHPRMVSVAEAAATRASKEVSIVPTASMAQGVAAASAYLEGDPDPTAAREAIEAAASGVRWGELGATAAPEAAAVDLVRSLEPDEAELLTLYLGRDASDEEGERVAAALRGAFPHLEVEVQRGDQPRSPYLIGIE